MNSDLQANAEEILGRVRAAAERSDRDPNEITVVAVSKTFERSLMDRAFELGFRAFGESRAQEIRQKCETPLPEEAELHMIGPLQTNKIRQILPHIDVLQTVDRPRLVKALAKELQQQRAELKVMLQVNVSGEEQKSGVAPEDASELLTQTLAAPSIQPIGLMTMAPYDADTSTQRDVFRGLRELRDELQQQHGVELPALSMGMSDDFEIAIAEGSTHVRIGRALFGARPIEESEPK